MAIQFPSVSGLSDGATQVINDVLYTLHKTSDTVFYWSASQADNPDSRYVLVTGDNMTGSLGGVTTFDADNLTDGSTTKTMTQVLSAAGAVGQVASFAQFDGGRNNSNVVTIQFSKNIAAITYVSQGVYQFEFTNDLPSSTYVILGASGFSGGPPVWEFGPATLDQTQSLCQGTYIQAVGGGDGRTVTSCGPAYVAMID